MSSDLKVLFILPLPSVLARNAHTDLQVPDFTNYRKESCKDPTSKSAETEASRKSFTYLMAGSATVGGIYAAGVVVKDLITSMSASADVLAVSKIEVALGDIPEGKNMTFKFRGKPLFVRHRWVELF